MSADHTSYTCMNTHEHMNIDAQINIYMFISENTKANGVYTVSGSFEKSTLTYTSAFSYVLNSP